MNYGVQALDGFLNEKITGNWINLVNTLPIFSLNEQQPRDFWGADKPCPNSLETKFTDF